MQRSTAITSTILLTAGVLLATAGSAQPASTVIEIESLAATATASSGQFGIQQMAGFGPGWGGDAQLFWGAPAPAGDGPRLTLRFELPTAGAYDLELYHTVAPDFGRFTLFLDGSPSSDVDGYHSSVAISRSVLGRHQLAAGAHELALRVTGKNASSSGYFVGLDRLEITAAAGAAPAPGQPAITISPDLLRRLRAPATPAAPVVRSREQREILLFDPATGRATYFDLAPDGSPARRRDIGVQWEPSSVFPVGRDFNGDGRWDLLRWIPERTTLEMVRFDVDGRVVQSEFAVNLLWHDPEIVPGDFNGDGREDVAVLDVASASVRTLQFDDDGVLRVFDEIHDYPFAALGSPHDLVGDRRDELLVRLGDGSVHLVGFDDSLSEISTLEIGSVEANRLSVGDFDGDGRPELIACATETGGLEIVDLATNGIFAGRRPLPSRAPQVATALYSRDWDGDGRDELALTEPGTGGLTLSVLFFDETGNLARSVPLIDGLPSFPVLSPFTAAGPLSALYREPDGTLRLVTFDSALQTQDRWDLARGLSADAVFHSRDFDGD